MNRSAWVIVGALLGASIIAGAGASADVSPGLRAMPPSAPQSPVIPPLPPGSQALYARLHARIPARLESWIEKEAWTIRIGQTSGAGWPSSNDPMLAGQNLSKPDIGALAFVVMMQAAKGTQEDLGTIMAGMKAMNKQKESVRRELAQVAQLNAGGANPQPSASPSAKPAGARESTADSLRNKLDSLNEQSDLEALRLQMAMDRMSKLLDMISSLMKDVHLTSEAILGNLK